MSLWYLPKKKGVFWGCLSRKFRRQILHIPGFLFFLVISSKDINETGIIFSYLFHLLWYERACPSPMPFFTTSETVVRCFSFMPTFPKLTGICMLGIRIWPVLEGILSAATTFWRVVVFEIGLPKLLPYLWIPEDRWAFESTWFRFFSVFLLQCSYYCLLHSFKSSESLPIGSFSYLSSPFLLNR